MGQELPNLEGLSYNEIQLITARAARRNGELTINGFPSDFDFCFKQELNLYRQGKEQQRQQ
jgi:hypothetical protein